MERDDPITVEDAGIDEKEIRRKGWIELREVLYHHENGQQQINQAPNGKGDTCRNKKICITIADGTGGTAIDWQGRGQVVNYYNAYEKHCIQGFDDGGLYIHSIRWFGKGLNWPL